MSAELEALVDNRVRMNVPLFEGQPELHAVSSGRVYYARLFYSYSVNADRYSGTWESSLLVNRQHILDTISANLPSGTGITVRYNPRKHQMSTADIDGSISESTR